MATRPWSCGSRSRRQRPSEPTAPRPADPFPPGDDGNAAAPTGADPMSSLLAGGPTVVQRPEELVELLPAAERFLAREAAVEEPAERRGLVLVHDLAGDFDAAHAGALAGAHLLAGL